MRNSHKDIANSLLTLVAIFGFISGEFIFSAVLFGASAIYANIASTNRLSGHANNLSAR